MERSSRRMNAAVLLAIVAVTGRSATAQQSMPARPQPVSVGDAVLTPAAQAKADSGRPPYTSADVRFMQGMIGHHGQAIVMAGWAPTHDARADVRILAERIAVAQQDEIAMMQRWLRDRRETAPDPGAPHAPDAHDEHAGMDMGGAGMPGMMPGMLTPEQLAQLDRARGPEFDRLFLTFMIQHHQGAVTMVKQLLAVPAAAQDDDVFRFVADVNVDQTTEIDRMRSMLAAPPPPSRP